MRYELRPAALLLEGGKVDGYGLYAVGDGEVLVAWFLELIHAEAALDQFALSN